jgi:putative PIN family toxin of toxin-antitoxin system
MVLVLDTSSILSYLMSGRKNNTWSIIQLAIRKELILVTSQTTLDELSFKIKEYSKNTGFKDNQKIISKFIAWYKYNSEHVTPTEAVTICRDPKDNKFLELANALKADYIISGDKDLLELGEFEGARILKPSEFLLEIGI